MKLLFLRWWFLAPSLVMRRAALRLPKEEKQWSFLP